MADKQCTQHTFDHPFYAGESCKDIYNMNPVSQNMSGYYWIVGTAQLIEVYYGMSYTVSSYEDIYSNNPKTGDNPGYYHIGTQWIYCNMTVVAANFISTCAGVGGEKHMWTPAQVIITPVDDIETLTLMLPLVV